jgi:membrane associated rhomboid family serine protease
MKHTIREEITGVLALVGAIWCVFIAGQLLPIGLESYGVIPRTLGGLIGVVMMPFLHADLAHLLNNTIPLTILLLLLAGSRANSWMVVVAITLLGGILLWLFGRPAVHLGASGLIYGLIAFLLVSGVLERRLVAVVIAIVVGFIYGGTLVSGILPSWGSHVSWDGHLFGAIAGAMVARFATRDGLATDIA